MSLFGRKEKKIINSLQKELSDSRKEIKRLKTLCDVKDSYFKEMVSDGLRHGSHLASKHMSDRKKYLQGK